MNNKVYKHTFVKVSHFFLLKGTHEREYSEF